ncbi:MAG: type II secretion system protein [Parachlamydiales bacterium]|nr:type II secretion system protein [Parachlamydiales bacterium]
MKNITIKRNFTLLEIVLTIVIISLFSSLIFLKMNTALEGHKIKSDIKKIDSYFVMCKKMAYTHQADIYLTAINEKKGMTLEIGTDENMGLFENQKKIKELLKNINFKFNNKIVDKVEIIFSSTGSILPKPNFQFFDKNSKIQTAQLDRN